MFRLLSTPERLPSCFRSLVNNSSKNDLFDKLIDTEFKYNSPASFRTKLIRRFESTLKKSFNKVVFSYNHNQNFLHNLFSTEPNDEKDKNLSFHDKILLGHLNDKSTSFDPYNIDNQDIHSDSKMDDSQIKKRKRKTNH